MTENKLGPRWRAPDTKLGRPTKYKEEYDEKVIELGKLGYHVEEMACAFAINTDTLYEWGRNYSSFSEAFTRAKLHSLCWYLKFGRHSLTEKYLNERTYENILKWKLKMGDKDRTFDLKELVEAKDYATQRQLVTEYFATGYFTTKEWLDVVNGLATLAKLDETQELRIMLDELKEKLG